MRLYDEFVTEMRKIADIAHAIGLLHWDTETHMPPGASKFRGQQIATLSGLVHGMFTDARLGRKLNALLADTSLASDERRNVELTLRDFEREIKLEPAFVEEMAAAKSTAFNQWVKARKANDFSIFQPALEPLIILKRKEAQIRSGGKDPYDALLDLYEPGLKASTLDTLFAKAKSAILPLLDSLNGRESNGDFLRQFYAKDAQWDFGIEVLQKIGYDMQHGRQDISAHPFTIGLSPQDVRVTTRIDEHDFLNMTWSCIHEGGHALYEQGLPADQYGMPLGSSASLGIHESQSRLWENHVGRSRAFWQHWYPVLQERFPENLKSVTLDDFYRGINRIRPNFIRTEADELHYHLHVIIRYEIERDYINSDLPVAEMRDRWNQGYADYLGVEVSDDANGILQDVHWSHGSFGYFPTYSIGSFYAAQFYEKAVEEMPGLEEQIANGDCSALLGWLRKRVHVHGRMYDPEDLCTMITGKPLDVSCFVRYITAKLQELKMLN